MTFDHALAERSHAGTSFSPDKRAQGEYQDYLQHMATVRAELQPLAETDEQRQLMETELAQYDRNYLAKLHNYLSARSRIVSPMIAGPANFPSRQMQKRGAALDRRANELTEWTKRARAAMRKVLTGAQTTAQRVDHTWNTLKTHIDRDLETARQIDTGKGQYACFTRSAFTTSVSGKLKRLADNGEAIVVKRALDYIAQQQPDMPKPFFAAHNALWVLADTAAKTADTPTATGETILYESAGVRVVNCLDDERVRIYFDAKPDAEMRATLRQNGWKWSPSNVAWQRKNTLNGINNARYLLEY